MKIAPFLLILLLTVASCTKTPEQAIQKQLDAATGVVTLPPGTIELTRELKTPAGARDLQIVGSPTTVLRFGQDFQGRAAIVVQDARNVKITGVQVDGGRSVTDRRMEIAPSGTPFYLHFQNNGIIVQNSQEVEISGGSFREVPGMAIIASAVKKIKIEKIRVEESGSRNGKNRNNTSGGVLLEEGVEDFEVRDSDFRKIRGNGVWTHSYANSPRNFRGVIANNRFEIIGRDAIQIGHANRIRVEGNTGKFIGFPFEEVDVEGKGIPVAIDTAGKVDETVYSGNKFEEINGKCFDLDGFHDGEVANNVCINRGKPNDYPQGNFALILNNTFPEMRSQAITIRDNLFDGTVYSGIYLIGQGHRVVNNRLININRARCNEGSGQFQCQWNKYEPDLMQAGIFLGFRAERNDPSSGILIEGNEIRGHKMSQRCVLRSVAIGEDKNTVRGNRCVDEDPS